MPDDRFLHRRAGHSNKVNLLTDCEYRVWTQYILSADDFGVMRGTHHPLQNDNDSLANRTAKVIQRCLEALVNAGLIRRFEHQGKPYVYQHDWQSWQKVSYPRTTTQPAPDKNDLAACDESTRQLFALHPGGAGRTRKDSSEKIPEIVPEHSPLMRGGAPAKRLTANGLRLTANGSEVGMGETAPAPTRPLAPLHVSSHRNHAHCGRICVHASQHDSFVRRRNTPNADNELRAWYLIIDEAWTCPPLNEQEPGDPFDFWRARYEECWPAAHKPTPKSRLDAWQPTPKVVA